MVVLLSRTKKAKHIYFIGDKDATIKHILDVLQKKTRFLPYISNVLKNLCMETIETPIFTLPPLYRPCDAIIGPVQCVYIIVSTKNTKFLYIGETNNLGQRIILHSTGKRAGATSWPSLQPWGVLGYVIGFDDRHQRVHFEAVWKVTCRQQLHQHGSIEGVLHIAHTLVQKHNQHRDPSHLLRFVRCGDVLQNTTPHPILG